MESPTWTWPDWRKAPSGTRFRHNQSGRLGTYIGPAKNRNNGAIVVWDNTPFPVRSVDGEPGHVFCVAPARELTPLL